MSTIAQKFGENVFNESAMRERLPKEVYRRLRRAVLEGNRLDAEIANTVANSMKDWALERGATHFTHWFQPMTGITAEKHDSFLMPVGEGDAIMEFSGKELIQGEPDASSFPNGGLRATFEARGYTAWDPTSYAFVKDGVLYIPTAFYSYGGEALDKKTPLLRSMEAINRQTMRVLRLFGDTETQSVRTTVGAEQEYFLVDEAVALRRKDLIYTGRTLFGAKPPKGQELDDHYFGAIKMRVKAFMEELDEELWSLGVPAKTEHNEAAPAQHELAPVFTTTNLAADQNQLTMELMQKVARRHGMLCLLHEKPFAGVNGSGKHNNWSIATDRGENLLDPGETPHENARFLLFLCAILKAVDDYQDLLRISVATAGNDTRLGGFEAPPAIISIFLGTELTEILEAIEKDSLYGAREKEVLKVGVHVLPRFARDTTDRNRTSPFAFTGNKFEFRMPGSSQSISSANTMINTAVAESLRQFADELEGKPNFEEALHDLIRRTITAHKRIIFNGNGYEAAWVEEAARRGLLNLPTTPDCIPYFANEKNVALFERHRVYSRVEVESRAEIMVEKYCNVVGIEAATMIEMVRRDILPSVNAYCRELAETAAAKRAIDVSADCEIALCTRLSALCAEAARRLDALSQALAEVRALSGGGAPRAAAYRDRVRAAAQRLRETVDGMETLTASDFWPYPTYGDLLFSIR